MPNEVQIGAVDPEWPEIAGPNYFLPGESWPENFQRFFIAMFKTVFDFWVAQYLQYTRYSYILQSEKVKYLRGAFWRSRSLKWPDFPCPSEAGFGIMPLSSTLSQLHILSIHRYSLWDVPTKTYRLLPVFVPLIIHNLTRAAYSLHGFHKLSWPGLKHVTTKWECQLSNHSANLACFNSGPCSCRR